MTRGLDVWSPDEGKLLIWKGFGVSGTEVRLCSLVPQSATGHFCAAIAMITGDGVASPCFGEWNDRDPVRSCVWYASDGNASLFLNNWDNEKRPLAEWAQDILLWNKDLSTGERKRVVRLVLPYVDREWQWRLRWVHLVAPLLRWWKRGNELKSIKKVIS